MKIMEINDNDHIATIVEKCVQKMEAMRTNIQNHHEKEINYMQNCFMGMKVKNDKIIKDTGVDQISLQNRLLAIEKKQAPCVINMKGMDNIENRLKIMEVNHSNQMSIIHNHIIAMEAKHTREMKTMEANHITLQDRFVKTELNQAKLIVRHTREMRSIHKRLEKRKSQV